MHKYKLNLDDEDLDIMDALYEVQIDYQDYPKIVEYARKLKKTISELVSSILSKDISDRDVQQNMLNLKSALNYGVCRLNILIDDIVEEEE